MGNLVPNIFTFVTVVVVSFVVLTLIAGFVRFHMLTRKVQEANPGEVDPEDVFQFRIVQELGAVHRTAAPFTILIVEPETPMGSDQPGDAWMDAFIKDMRRILRAEDEVFRIREQQCGVLGRFSHERAETVVRRLSQQLAQDGGARRHPRWTARIGVASHPEHGERAAELMEAVRTALAQVGAGSPNRYHLLPVPKPDVNESGAERENEKQEQQTRALLDELTGVLRADRLSIAAQKFVARQRRNHRAVSVMYLSVDHFQQYRDLYGTAAADALLKGVADLMADHTRETDVLARAAESEFAVVMDCAPNDALTAAQRVSVAIKKAQFRSGAGSLRVGVSVGVAGYPDHTGQARDLLAYAQAAMAAARARGRSMCLLYQPDMQPQRRDDQPVDMF